MNARYILLWLVLFLLSACTPASQPGQPVAEVPGLSSAAPEVSPQVSPVPMANLPVTFVFSSKIKNDRSDIYLGSLEG